MSEREAELLRVQDMLVTTITELARALESTRLIMTDKESRDYAGNMVRTAREVVHTVQQIRSRA